MNAGLSPWGSKVGIRGYLEDASRVLGSIIYPSKQFSIFDLVLEIIRLDVR